MKIFNFSISIPFVLIVIAAWSVFCGGGRRSGYSGMPWLY